MSSYSYCVRITRSYELCRQLVDIWQDRCEKVAVYEHVGQATQKTHIHMVLCNANVCKKQLKNLLAIHNITTQGNLGGNKDWSFKNWDGDENACAYMTKGYIKWKFLKGWTDEDHQRWCKMWRGKPEKISKKQEMYDECFDETQFVPAWNYYVKNNRVLTDVDSDFKFIRQWVRRHIFWLNGDIWDIQAINQYKMLVYSYCYRNNILIPAKDSVFREF